MRQRKQTYSDGVRYRGAPQCRCREAVEPNGSLRSKRTHYCTASANTASVTRENYKTASDGKLRLDGRTPLSSAYSIHRALCDFIKSDGYPCVGARAALNGGDYRLGHYSDMGSAGASSRLAQDLSVFIAQRPYMKTDFATMIAVFDNSDCRSEGGFQGRLWKQLQRSTISMRRRTILRSVATPRIPGLLSALAALRVGDRSAPRKLADGATFRLAGPGFFNPHDQFESLRRKGVYQRLGRIVRSRDISFQGSLKSQFGRVRTTIRSAAVCWKESGEMVEMSVSRLSGRLRPQSGCAFMLAARESLEITDPLGQQVADLAIFRAADPAEYFSAGRTLDYNQRIYLTTGDAPAPLNLVSP